jgi:hypothetical protein
LDTKNYAGDCQLLVNHVLHHDADGNADQTARATCIQSTKALISQQKGQETLSLPVWNFLGISTTGIPASDSAEDEPEQRRVRLRLVRQVLFPAGDEEITIRIHDQHGQEESFRLNKSTPMSEVFRIHAASRGVSEITLRYMLEVK